MTNNLATIFLESINKRMLNYKELAEKAMKQLQDTDLFIMPQGESNSIAIIIQHMSGNMISRWTNFLTTDGEKEWRDRDLEFEPVLKSKEEVMQAWEKGWACFFEAISDLTEDDLTKLITIRNEKLTVTDALHRQLAHYPYHIGQIVFLAKMLKQGDWDTLSIPKKKSAEVRP
jgi:hypothetical protein